MALKILRKETVDLELTYEDVRDQKAIEPFKTNRQTSKTLNFLLIYGGSANVLATQLELEWPMSQCLNYIKDERLEHELEDMRDKYYGRMDDDSIVRLCCATRLRENYFKGYPGLLRRGDKEIKFAEKHGYVRSYFGATRKLIELKLRGTYDNKRRSKEMRNCENICRNTSIQNLESCIVKKAMIEFENWTAENNKKSMLMNEVHDSIDTIAHKTELKDDLARIKHLAERRWPETKLGIVPLKIDVEIADLNAGDCYKCGRDPSEFGIEMEGLEFEDPAPFNVETTPEFDLEYFRNRKEHWNKKGIPDPLEKEIEKYLEKYSNSSL